MFFEVAVVVDTFADARLNDVENLAQEMEDEIEHDRTALAKLFARIDKDGSGQLTLQELIEGARDDSGFQSRLRVMDIDEHDLEQLFQMIDVDQSGTIEVAEFIGPLSRWAHDSKTAPRFIKYNMIQTMHLQEDLYELSVDCFNQLASRIDDLSLQIRGVRGQTVPSGASRMQRRCLMLVHELEWGLLVCSAWGLLPQAGPLSGPLICRSAQQHLGARGGAFGPAHGTTHLAHGAARTGRRQSLGGSRVFGVGEARGRPRHHRVG